MALTVADCNLVLTRRCAAYLTAASLSAEAGDFMDPLRWALSMLGTEAGSVVAVADADLSAVTGRKVDALLDLAEARLLQTCLTNLTQVTTTAGPVTQQLSDLSKHLAPLAAARMKDAAARHADLLVAPLDGTALQTVRIRAA